MNNEKFISELHDIGKLINKELRNLIEIKDHPLINSKYDQYGNNKPSFPSWWTQYHHKKNVNNDPDDWSTEDDVKNWKDIPDEYKSDLFILIIADHLAASSSRSTLEIWGFTPNDKEVGNPEKQEMILKELGIDKLHEIRGIIKLWNRKYYQEEEIKGNQWAAFDKSEDIDRIFDEIQNCQSGKEFLGKYEKYLRLTPEDKSLPRNITSLYTHLELVGKIYRILKKHTHFEKNGEEFVIRLNDQKEVKSTGEAEGGKQTIPGKGGTESGNWQARLVKCHIGFYQSPVRLHDVNIFKKRDELIIDLLSQYRDNVIFYTFDFVELFLIGDEDLHEIFRGFTNTGFYVKCIETTADLGILKSNLDDKVLKAKAKKEKSRIKVLKDRNTKVRMKIISKHPEAVLKSTICEVCQINESLKSPWIHENIEEWICQSCRDIRKSHTPFSEYYDEWQGEKVCWFKFTLDQDKLEKWLQKSFKNYLDSVIRCFSRDISSNEKILGEIGAEIDKINAVRNDYIKVVRSFVKDMTKKKAIDEKIKELGSTLKLKEAEKQKVKKGILKTQEFNKNFLKLNEEFRPLAPQVDFNNDYKELLSEFWIALDNENGLKKPIAEYDELGVFLYSAELTWQIIRKYLSLIEKYFPDCSHNEEFPVSLSLSFANIKYPVREHWRFFESGCKNFLNIHNQNIKIKAIRFI